MNYSNFRASDLVMVSCFKSKNILREHVFRTVHMSLSEYWGLQSKRPIPHIMVLSYSFTDSVR